MEELDQVMKDEFLKTFEEIKEEFKIVFSKKCFMVEVLT